MCKLRHLRQVEIEEDGQQVEIAFYRLDLGGMKTSLDQVHDAPDEAGRPGGEYFCASCFDEWDFYSEAVDHCDDVDDDDGGIWTLAFGLT